MTENTNPPNDLANLLKDLYAEADRLPEADWRTAHLREFHLLCRANARAESGWSGRLDAIKRRIDEAWESYRATPVTERERTAETVAGHRLLVEGFAGWLEAVELCRQGEFEAAKEAAVEANRLLILVQKQKKRLSSTLERRPTA